MGGDCGAIQWGRRIGQMRAAIRGVLVVAIAIGVSGGAKPVVPQASSSPHAAPAPEQRVDINYASLDDLLKVPGMTRTWAERIVRFRPYRTKQDLLDKGVVSGEVYNRIKDYIIAHREKR